MTSEDSSKPAVVSSLPDSPVPSSTLEKVEKHEKILNIVPLKVEEVNGEMVVYDFTLELQETAYAIRYDREDGWMILAQDEDVEEVGVELQNYHHENEL